LGEHGAGVGHVVVDFGAVDGVAGGHGRAMASANKISI
jgi:hypothetical protein